MNSCCQATEKHFDIQHAEKDLNRIKLHGPDSTTKGLLSLLTENSITANSHLDIGSGIGVLALELLNSGTKISTIIDASRSYLKIARSEAIERGVMERLNIIHGDAVEDAHKLDEADLVTLDRVLCCYPNLENLVNVSTSKAKNWYAASYPRNRWFVRIGNTLVNGLRKIKGNAFRTYVHDTERIDSLIRSSGFTRIGMSESLIWKMVLYKSRQKINGK